MTSLSQQNLSSIDRHQQALVVGLGVSGYSAVRYLSAKGLTVRVVDGNPEPALSSQLAKEFPEVVTQFGANNITIQESLVVASPGVPLKSPLLQQAAQQGAEIVGDIELFAQANQQTLIAITGSNGKSTVTTLVGEMCKAAGLKPLVAGNIGAPVLDALVEELDYDVAVLELSSFQLETTRHLNADCASILNISADHMDRYESMGDYILAKARILRGAERAVLPAHASNLEQITKANKTLRFSMEAPANDDEFGVQRLGTRRWLMRGKERLMLLRDVPLVGLHNIQNVLSAFALTDFLKLPVASLVDAVKSFKGLPHRMQTVADQAGVRWVNDSKATNIGATQTALNSLEGDVIWLAGGQSKDADFFELRSVIKANIKALIAYGEDASKLVAVAEALTNVIEVANLKEAVEQAGQLAQDGTTVLLSPACASFDQFENFEHRGNEYAALVNALLVPGGRS